MNFVTGTEYDKSCRRYRKGEVVAVAQSYETISNAISKTESKEKAAFYCNVIKTCYPNEVIARDKEDIAGWNNKMFVRSELMSHQIHISNVRIERLQEISDDDCLKEGLEWDGVAHKYYVNYDKTNGSKIYFKASPKESYAELIDKVSGKGTWESNPYVFVYDFNLVK